MCVHCPKEKRKWALGASKLRGLSKDQINELRWAHANK